MKDKVIFLDVDGVLNRCGKSHRKLEADLIALLCRIVDETDATIVLSSTWRLFPKAVEELEAVFRDSGLVIHSHTPDLSSKRPSGVYVARQRGDEIQKWMEDNWTPANFVILDDNSDMSHLIRHLLKTSSFAGLTPFIVQQAIARLNSPAN